jgi:hypothetical protein
MDLNELKYGPGFTMMKMPLYGCVLLWMQPYVEEMSEDEFFHFIGTIKRDGLTPEQKESIRERRKSHPNAMPPEFGAYLNITLDCIFQENMGKLKRLGYTLNPDQISIY